MTLVDYMAKILRPYSELEEFAYCIEKTLDKLGYCVNVIERKHVQPCDT